ncbi:MAG: hypothetical protein LBL00_04750 [Endomicrobium sp.]|jgi:hypothetical protein|nr:hypothetical protein [Endomicrobium sp.]
METGSSQEMLRNWIITDIFKLAFTTVKNNFFGMIAVLLFYTIVPAAVLLLLQRGATIILLLSALFCCMLPLSLISVLRGAFENGKLKLGDVVPSLGFIGKLILFLFLNVAAGIILRICFFLFFLLFGNVIINVFLKDFLPYTVFACIGLGLFVYFAYSIFSFFCFVSFCGKNGFWESLGNALQILTENKLFFFCVFAFLSGILVLIIYLTVGFNYEDIGKIMSFQQFIYIGTTVLMPFFDILLVSAYFTLGHEAKTKQVFEPEGYFGRDHLLPEENKTEENREESREDEDSDSFSLSNALYFSWGIYKKLFFKLTAGIIAVYAAIVALFYGVIMPFFRFLFQRLSMEDFILYFCAALVIYYCLMFLYVSFVIGFFRGKGIKIKNFFPPFKTVLKFAGFVSFIAVFLFSIPFIIEKIDMLLKLAASNFPVPYAAIVAGSLALFALIVIYVLVVLFYTPFFILDGQTFSESLSLCSDMMKGQRTAFFCILFALFIINLIGHLLVFAWIFTVPFSVLVIIQIYIAISDGYSGYKEDIVQ